ncbi:MAG TPA: tRNA glutamyl-Q(34) synthetase GluQRS [Alphaproteobacteria bacterium]|nr:tRNA glutamyl-Q(34) synthetase GluQRS [Alphaproteobacteria bacterium]
MSPAAAIVTRFAPSPTGGLHLGHAYAALFAERAARAVGGRFLLRIEDIDRTRVRAAFEDAIFEDLAWLGLAWETPVRRQSEHMADYGAALARLEAMHLVYPCFCTRAEIAREIASAAAAPHGSAMRLYPGTCRRLSPDERNARRAAGERYALRLDVAAAVARAGTLCWYDRGRGKMRVEAERHGDVVLARKELGTSYHLAVTVDDALQGVTLVTRGEDLLAATDVHRLLQALLGLAVPDYHHHPLLFDQHGQRLAKRAGAATLAALRAAGVSAGEVRARAGFPDA